MGPPPSASKQFEALQSDVNDYFPHAITIHAGDSIGFQPGFHNVDFPKRGGKHGAFIAPRPARP